MERHRDAVPRLGARNGKDFKGEPQESGKTPREVKLSSVCYPDEEGGFQPTTTMSSVQGTQSLVPVVGGLESTQGLNPSAETPQEFVHPGGFDTMRSSLAHSL